MSKKKLTCLLLTEAQLQFIVDALHTEYNLAGALTEDEEELKYKVSTLLEKLHRESNKNE